jgi:hypothetical protein
VSIVELYNSARPYFLPVACLIGWVAWWLLGVNWNKAWRVLGQGAWVPLVLIVIVAALVWSQIAPSSCACLGFVSVPNFWWQLGGLSLLVCSMLFLGWLQGYFGWTPAEVQVEPPHAQDEHGHVGHGADTGHGPEYGHVHVHDPGHHHHHHD